MARLSQRHGALVLVALASALVLSACGSPLPEIKVVGQPSISINVALSQIGCTGQGICVGVGANGTSAQPTTVAQLRSHAGQWSNITVPSSPQSALTTSACSLVQCLFGGSGPSGDLLWRYSNNAIVALSTPRGGHQIRALSCPTVTVCEMLDSTSGGTWRLSISDDSATTWSTTNVVAWLHGASSASLSCLNSLTCDVGDTAPSSQLAETHNAGKSWQFQKVPSDWSGIVSLTCSTHCVVLAQRASDHVVASATNRGWSVAATPINAVAMACSRAMRCSVVGSDTTGAGALAEWIAGGWRRMLAQYVPTPLIAVSCIGSLCAASGSSTVLAWRP